METPKKLLLKKRLISAVAGALFFVGFMILFEKLTEPEIFQSKNYWLKKSIMWLFMFALYMVSDQMNAHFSNLFRRKQK